MLDDFSKAALVLIGHGASDNAGSAQPVLQQAAELRRRRRFARVLEAFWKQDPQLLHVVAEVSEPQIFLVPLFISEGFFTEVVIPKALGLNEGSKPEFPRVISRGQQTWFYCRPVGSHPGMTGILLSRAASVVQQFPFPRAPKPRDISLFIAGHGTEQNQKSREAIERQVELIRAQNLYAEVHAVFMEEEPRIQSCYETAHSKHIVVVPFFISDGLHVQEDIPVMLGEPQRLVQARLEKGQATWRNPTEKKGKLVWLASAIGTEPLLADVIMERVAQAADGTG
jgi:sirohydrochlorin cobaltochelatase